MSETNGRDWQRLARLVIHQRVKMGYRYQTEFSAASGIKIRTLNNIENARATSYDPATIARLEQGLQWSAGSVDAVLAGGEPTVVEQPDDPVLTELLEARRLLIEAIRMDDPVAMRELLADALAVIARVAQAERQQDAG